MGGGPAIGEGGSSLPLPPPLPPRKDQDSIGTQSSRFTQQDRNVSPYSRKGTRSRPSGGRRGASPGYNTENRGGVGGGGTRYLPPYLPPYLISSSQNPAGALWEPHLHPQHGTPTENRRHRGAWRRTSSWRSPGRGRASSAAPPPSSARPTWVSHPTSSCPPRDRAGKTRR